MPVDQPALWGSGDAYERYMGRWSRKIAPLFLDWIGIGPSLAWLDVGCGTGVLTSAILSRCDPSRVLAVDPSAAFLASARARQSDIRISFEEGNALNLPSEGDAFDVAVAGLVLNFVADKRAMLAEMSRVVRRGGTVALYVWDYAGHMQIMRTFFDAARALDVASEAFDDGVKAPECRPGPLRDLFREAGLDHVQVTNLDVPAAFDSFEDYWTPFLGGTGSAPKYIATLNDAGRERLKNAVRQRIYEGPDGEILMPVRAWAVKGRVVD